MSGIYHASRQDEVDVKLTRLRKATIAVEKLLWGEHTNSNWRVVIEPDWSALNLPLAKLTAVYDFDCVELAKILTTSSYAKLVPITGAVQDAARWLVGIEKHSPALLQNPGGFAAIEKAAKSGDTKFFISLGDYLRNQRKNSRKGVNGFSNLKCALSFHWQPNPRLNWPGLAYCKESALWDFLLGLEVFDAKAKHGKNYLSNLISRLGLIWSRENRFISGIEEVKGRYHFS